MKTLLSKDELKRRKAEKIDNLAIRRELKNELKKLQESRGSHRDKIENINIQLGLIEEELVNYHDIHINQADITNRFAELDEEIMALENEIKMKKEQQKRLTELWYS